MVGVVLLFAGLFVVIEWGILGKSPSAALLAAGQSVTGGGTGEAPPSPSLFGVRGTFSGYGETYDQAVAQADPAGLISMGSRSPFAHDFDYAASAGQPVILPPGGDYSFLGDVPGPWGHLLYFQAPNGGVFGLPHIENIPSWLASGWGSIPGGTQIGTVGAGPYSKDYWSGPHLAIIADQAAVAWFNQAQAYLFGQSGLAHPPGP